MIKFEDFYIAGINTEEEVVSWIRNGMPDTGYTFIRNIDGFDMGNMLNIGMDWSLVNIGMTVSPRKDTIDYYTETKIENDENENEISDNTDEEIIDEE